MSQCQHDYVPYLKNYNLVNQQEFKEIEASFEEIVIHTKKKSNMFKKTFESEINRTLKTSKEASSGPELSSLFDSVIFCCTKCQHIFKMNTEDDFNVIMKYIAPNVNFNTIQIPIITSVMWNIASVSKDPSNCTTHMFRPSKDEYFKYQKFVDGKMTEGCFIPVVRCVHCGLGTIPKLDCLNITPVFNKIKQ